MPKIVQIAATTTDGDKVPTLFALDDEGRMWRARINSLGKPTKEWVEVLGPDVAPGDHSDD